MKSSKILFLLVLSVATIGFKEKSFAQGEATMLFLKIPASPQSNAMGWSGTALPTDNAFAFQFNPAMLGYAAKTTNLNYQPYLRKTDWLPSAGLADLTFDSDAINLGYRSKSLFTNMPVRFGVGYMTTKLNYGNHYQTDINGNIINTFSSSEKYEAFGLGIGLESFIDINFGLTYKSIRSNLGTLFLDNAQQKAIAKVNAVDIGVLLNIPLIHKKSLENLKNGDGFNTAELSLGYAMLNVGGKAQYLDYMQKDPIPREARLGFAVSFSRSWVIDNRELKAIAIRWTTDASDLLIDPKTHEYGGGLLGDINLWDEWVSSDAEDSYIYRGGEIQLLEYLQFRYGQFRGPGYEKPLTWGVGIQSSGIFKSLATGMNSPTLDFIAEHVNIRFNFAEYREKDKDYSPLHGTRFYGLEFQIGGF